jgi:hypothetical protein
MLHEAIEAENETLVLAPGAVFNVRLVNFARSPRTGSEWSPWEPD